MDLAILGYGVVGSGVARLLERNRAGIAMRAAQPSLRLKYILDVRDFPGDPFGPLVVHDIAPILRDPDIAVVAETIGGLHPAFDYVLACLRAGKSVVTSNKELVAVKGYELLQAAKERGVNLLFEASVGGGIPIIRPLSQCLAANELSEVSGVLNGTTNFILTRMLEDAMPFDRALRLAQEKGYAERDPSADIEGADACRKICILATLAFGRHVYPGQVRTEGIAGLTLEDAAYADKLGCCIKLLGRAKRLPDGRVTALVAPMLIPRGASLLACVSDVYNAILIRGDAVDDVVFYGRGAGQFPTASAVVADIIDCARHIGRRRFFEWEDGAPGYVAPAEEDVAKFYVRVHCDNPAAARQALLSAFPGASFIEIGAPSPGELAFLTLPVQDGAARATLAALPEVKAEMLLRVAEF
ncbi:MAG: homoserine dehydrogenase [Oscillospiraceae bacterium]|nr:homoserine dehydrogenase [Oscillospiraceae bacterium]